MRFLSQGDDEARVRELASLKSYLESRLSELKKEQQMLSMLVAMVDEELAARSFKPAELKHEVKEQLKEPTGSIRRIIGKSGNLLATAFITTNELRITISPEVEVKEDSRPFSTFLISRVLESMARSDLDKVRTMELEPGNELSYEVIKDGESVREIVIRNYRDDARLREILSSIRWTLDTIFQSRTDRK